jgi:uncharacterized protein YyaL (SSP411 family)
MANRLIHEKSPYLLQHAHNPVDWYPWGEEAFTKAREESKPIFLSIGYSTCHWCHVMERESFENESIAAMMNRDFVCIKVDREERPDVDRIYMTYVQATTGSGGWPMSVWLTPELRPFVGGTYFPPDNRYGRTGFPVLLDRIADAWKKDRERIEQSSINVLEQLQEHIANAPGTMDSGAIESGFNFWRRSFDSRLGGFGQAPKFPRPVTYNFLLRYWFRSKNREALDMVLATVRAMAKGGMNDQLGGGFHRYSVDEYWFVPHFEKMLYDQAQLAVSYLEAFEITGDKQYADEVRRILDYVMRDMTHPAGGFYSAEDADSVIDPAHPHEKGEGAFYIWTEAEIEAIAGQPATKWFCYRYGVEPNGNVRNDPHAEFTGRNILFEAHSVDETAHHFEVDETAVAASLRETSDKLSRARSKRVRPHLDDKVLAGWNGLMISAFAQAGAALGEARYVEAARRAADFIAQRMVAGGVLYRRFRDGETAIPGFLDDYAGFVQGLIDLYEAAFDPRDLQLAVQLARKMIELFEDREGGGFFSTAGGDASLVMRVKDDYDGAEPSGNSLAALDLLRLAAITGDSGFRESAERTLAAFARKMSEQPAGLPQMLVGYLWSIGKPVQVILAGERRAADTRALAEAVHRRFLPNRVMAMASDSGGDSPGETRGMSMVEGRATAYLCENFACQLPVNTLEKFELMLDELLE